MYPSCAGVTLHSITDLAGPWFFKFFPGFHCKVIALKSRKFVLKGRTMLGSSEDALDKGNHAWHHRERVPRPGLEGTVARTQ